MINGFLVSPDHTHRTVSITKEDAAELLGSSAIEKIKVAFNDEGPALLALVDPEARRDGAEPNPTASLGKNQEATGNPAFYTDPTAAIYGSVIFVGIEGEGEGVVDISESSIELVKDGMRAAASYREDQSEEYMLWRNAAINMA